MARKVRLMRSGVTSAALALTAIGLATSAEAAVLNFDFGPTSVGSATSIDPYHATTGDVGNLTWNTTLGVNDIAINTLKYGNGTTATGVSVNVGVTSTTSTAYSDLVLPPSTSSALGNAYKTGIYGGNTSPAKDAIFDSDSGKNDRGITLQVSGLAAGTYDIYYVGRNTNLDLGQIVGTQSYTQTMYAGTTATSGDFSFATFDAGVISYPESNTDISSWTLGDTYTKLTVTVAEGEYLDLAFVGAGQETRGFLNSLQIVAVPEPASFVMLSLGSLALLAYRKPRSQK